MTSYFEIGGHIVECDLTSLLSPYQMVSAAERPERGRISARSQASSMPQTSRPRTRADIHRETQKFLIDFYMVPFRNVRSGAPGSPVSGAGFRNAKDQQNRMLEFYEYLSN